DAFAKAGEVYAAKQLAKREETLRYAINYKAVLEALIQLVTSYVEWYQKKYYQDLRDDYLTPDEWSALGEMRAFLQPFWKITQLTEGRYATLDRSLFTMDVLHKHYTQLKEANA
ncbi:hypothetical protein FocTR4_00012244, partial [Fusarium oxysporum f. sp. cubense]